VKQPFRASNVKVPSREAGKTLRLCSSAALRETTISSISCRTALDALPNYINVLYNVFKYPWLGLHQVQAGDAQPCKATDYFLNLLENSL